MIPSIVCLFTLGNGAKTIQYFLNHWFSQAPDSYATVTTTTVKPYTLQGYYVLDLIAHVLYSYPDFWRCLPTKWYLRNLQAIDTIMYHRISFIKKYYT